MGLADSLPFAFSHSKCCGQLISHPDSGSKPHELGGGRYRQIVDPPCRIFYRREGETGYVLYVVSRH